MKDGIRFVTLTCILLLALATANAQTVDIYGQVRIYNGTCNAGIGMNGITVLLYSDSLNVSYSIVTHTDSAFMVAHGLTSPMGIYYFNDVPYSLYYYVEVVPPLGVVLATNPQEGSWWNANPRAVGNNFYRCFLMVLEGGNFSPHTIGYWKHQATVAVTGQGNAQVPAAQLQGYYNTIFNLFNDPPYFPIAGVTTVNGGPLTPQAALAMFDLPNGGPAGMVNKAKKQLLGLLLNVVAEYVYVWQEISIDDRTVSQAISFGANMIKNNGAALGTAKDAMDYINNGITVPAGWIPGSYGMIYYGNPATSVAVTAELPESPVLLGNYPNPFNPQTIISFALPDNGFVKLSVFDISGRQMAQLVNGWREAGYHEVTFDASGLASGMYLYRLSAGNTAISGKMMLVK